jgi:uncharacterized protein with NAD-binding domain and iron-sulfur cluster
MARPRIVVLGGGVAGMAAALEMSASCDVTLVEAQAEFGGKLGGTEAGGRVHEHGFHFYADYYVNLLDIIAQLGIPDLFVPREAVKFLWRGGFPTMRELRNPASERYFWHNAHNGPVDWTHWVLYAYSVLDLLLSEFQESDFLDLLSVNSYLASKPYVTVEVALLHQQSLLKTLSLASYRTAISSYQRWMNYVLAYPEPMMRVMRCNSLDGFVRPFAAHLESLGVKLLRETKATRIVLKERGGEVIISRPLSGANGDSTALPFDGLVIAVAMEQLSELLDDQLFEATSRFRRNGFADPPPLGNIRELQSAPMASLDIQFKHRITGMPPEHITFLQSEFDISCIDNSQLWSSGDASYINAVASDVRSLNGLSEDYKVKLLLDEVLIFLGQRAEAVDSVTFRSNTDAPLFLNEIGSWHDRPEVFTAVPTIVVAGDYVRNSFGLASVEGAIVAARQAALCLSRNLGVDHAPKILYPHDVDKDQILRRKELLEPLKARALGTLWAGRDRLPTTSALMD